MKTSPCMIRYEMLPSDALKVGLIKIPLGALLTKCSPVHYVPGTTISPMYKELSALITRKAAYVYLPIHNIFLGVHRVCQATPIESTFYTIHFAIYTVCLIVSNVWILDCQNKWCYGWQIKLRPH